jgi:methyl-accepting chemotaxis protein
MEKLFAYLTLRQKMWGGFGFLLIIVAAVSVASILALDSTRKSVVHVVNEIQPTLLASIRLDQALESSAQSLGFYLLGHEDSDKQEYLRRSDNIVSALKDLKGQKTIQDSAEIQKLIGSIETRIDQYRSYQDRMFTYATSPEANMPALAISSRELNPRARDLLQLFSQMLDADADTDDEEIRFQIARDMGELRYVYMNILNELRGYLFSRDAALIENLKLYADRANEILTKLKAYDDALGFEQTDAIEKFETVFADYYLNLQAVIKAHASESWRNDAFVLRKELGPLLAGIKNDLNRLVTEQQEIATNESGMLLNEVSDSETFVSIMFVIGMIIGLLSAMLISKLVIVPIKRAVVAMNDIAEGEGDLTRRLDAQGRDEIAMLGEAFNKFAGKVHGVVSEVMNSVRQLNSAASGLSVITSETSTGVARQQSETEQVATAMNEMASTVQEVASHAEQAASAANDANQHSQEGNRVVTASINSIEELAKEIENASGVITNLEQDSENIGTVLDVIRGIAEQTNLLALNAAIEAARAGEQGRGFAVVADEVRTLASRTQQSTQEIQTMIERLQHGARDAVNVMKTSQSRTTDTVDHANEAGKALNSISSYVGDINNMNLQIASAADEQSSVAEEINQNVVRIADIAQETSGSMQQIAASSEDLARLSTRLDQLVGNFKV